MIFGLHLSFEIKKSILNLKLYEWGIMFLSKYETYTCKHWKCSLFLNFKFMNYASRIKWLQIMNKRIFFRVFQTTNNGLLHFQSLLILAYIYYDLKNKFLNLRATVIWITTITVQKLMYVCLTVFYSSTLVIIFN